MRRGGSLKRCEIRVPFFFLDFAFHFNDAGKKDVQLEQNVLVFDKVLDPQGRTVVHPARVYTRGIVVPNKPYSERVKRTTELDYPTEYASHVRAVRLMLTEVFLIDIHVDK